MTESARKDWMAERNFITWKQFERYWYIFSLAVIIASMPFSKLGLSIGQMMLLGGWIVERFDYRKWLSSLSGRTFPEIMKRIFPLSFRLLFEGISNGFRQFARNKPALIFSSILLMHILGLIFTVDFNYAIKDLRTKVPILLLPLILSTSESFDRKGFYRYMILFVLAVVVRSIFNGWQISTHFYSDIREVSGNISHIIFSLLIALSIYTLVFFILKRGYFTIWQKGIMLGVMIWLFIYIVMSRSVTGFAITLLTIFILLPFLFFRVRNQWIRITLALGVVALAAGLFFSLRSVVRDYYHVNPVDFSKLDKTTALGNPYIHNPNSTQTENGTYVWIYIQWDELRQAWNKRSRIPFDSLNKKNETVAFTVVRFLASKGWRKDALAIERLTPKEIIGIENGVANYLFLEKFSVRSRIYEFLWGYDNYRKTGNPTGSTLMQRLEFWRASLGIIRNNWLIGVGTGDMNLAFKAQYEQMHSKLSPEQRWRSHNQFLSICTGFGIFGLIWFLFSIFYPPARLHRYDDYFILVFLIILTTSMLTGDTIESQTGVSFFAIFYSLFLFARREKDVFIPQSVRY